MPRYNYRNTVKRILALIMAGISSGLCLFLFNAIFQGLKGGLFVIFIKYGIPILIFVAVYVYIYYSVWEGDKEQTWRH